jgi:hypothetical protein
MIIVKESANKISANPLKEEWQKSSKPELFAAIENTKI